MKVISSVDFSILEDGTYRLDKAIVYFSPRYKKTITVPESFISDGATGAMDIASRAWFIHDILCAFGKWDDGTKLSNWQCSQVLQDVLVEEGRYWQSKRWFWATWFMGGGEARKNGMLSVAVLALVVFLGGCSTVNCNFTGSNNTVTIEVPKTVTTSPAAALTTGDNSIPASVIP